MRLGWMDRAEGKTVYMYPKKGNKEDYADKFFREIKGLGNIAIVKVEGSKYRKIAIRGIGGR